MRYFFSIFLLILIFNVNGENTKVDQSLDLIIEKFEKKVQEVIKKNNIPENNLFYHYILAARNLKINGQDRLAKKYYRKGLSLSPEIKKNKLRAFLEYGHYLVILEDNDELGKIATSTNSFISDNNFKFSNSHIKDTVNYFKVVSSEKLTKNAIGLDHQQFEDTVYWESILDYEFEKRMELGLFNHARDMFKGVTDDSFFERVLAYDLLNIIKSSGVENQLKCENLIKESNFENRSSSMDVCFHLMNIKKGNSYSKLYIKEPLEQLGKLQGRGYLKPTLKRVQEILL